MTNPLDLPEAAIERLARAFHDSPALTLAREMALTVGPELTGAAAETAKLLAGRRAIGVDPSVLVSFADIDQMKLVASAANALAEFKPIGIDPEVIKSLTAAGSLNFDSMALGSIAEAHKALADFGKPYGGVAEVVRAIGDHQASLVASLEGVIGDASRFNQWAAPLGKIDIPDLSRLYAGAPNIAAQIAKMHEDFRANFAGLGGYNPAGMSAMLGLNHQFDAVLETTSFKMSAFAGVTDVVGFQSPVREEAYRSLFGEWRTRPDLPACYWRDPRARRRMYDAADVDPGLAGAGLGLAVEIMVESGLAMGMRSESNAVAVIRVGDMSMTIRSRGTRTDAFALLSRFEEKLRAYIARKLSDRFGPDWFKHRVDGNTVCNAKRARVQALQRGEASLPLINYTDLGDLSNIIRASKNWDEVFEDVFANNAELDHDMQKLIAARRPTMHARPIDGLRLVEMVCVINRISQQMADDGAWKLLADSDQ